MVVTIEITFKRWQEKDGKKVRVDEARTFTVDSEDMPLILAEDESVGLMRGAMADYLGLTEEESRHLTLRHLKQIAEGIKAAGEIPNG